MAEGKSKKVPGFEQEGDAFHSFSLYVYAAYTLRKTLNAGRAHFEENA